VLFSSVYNLFALLGRKAPFTHSLTLYVTCELYGFSYYVFPCYLYNALFYGYNEVVYLQQEYKGKKTTTLKRIYSFRLHSTK